MSENVYNEKKGSIIMAMIWIFVVSILLFWLPALGPLIAGIVGGKVAGGVLPGFMAVLLPGLILAGVLFFAGTFLTGVPLIGAIAGGSAIVLVVVQVAPLLVGALIGGLLA